MNKLGVMTTMLRDLEHIIRDEVFAEKNDIEKENVIKKTQVIGPIISDLNEVAVNDSKENKIPFDFQKLKEMTVDPQLTEMDGFFQGNTGSYINKYTGVFEGYNLIMLTCEGFSSYAIDEKLTPTLYKMSREGFVFNNFYNPIWGVSTSDGEFVACNSLVPTAGIWSFSKSSENWLPFTLGNQFRALGYETNAYHDHQYSYYDRDRSHPNMGYTYKGVGNGLKIKSSWPESDLEMMNKTGPEYISDKPFHTYYMTVSGHMLYNFEDNYIAFKNKKYVDALNYSEPVKAYLAANLELEFAMNSLIAQLEAAGVADKTVIVLSPDHYPYGLPKENIDEIAGHEVEDNFELYRSTFIIWNKNMKSVEVNKVCSSMDILPTLSNLFGLAYDSRMMMGNDILSTEDGLVMFSNRSWITERASFNSQTNAIVFNDQTESDEAYIESINKTIDDKFRISKQILEYDYYRHLYFFK